MLGGLPEQRVYARLLGFKFALLAREDRVGDESFERQVKQMRLLRLERLQRALVLLDLTLDDQRSLLAVGLDVGSYLRLDLAG